MKRVLAALVFLGAVHAAIPVFNLRGRPVGAVAVAADENGTATAWLTLVEVRGSRTLAERWLVVYGFPEAGLPALAPGDPVAIAVRPYRPHRYGAPYPGPRRYALAAPAGPKGGLPRRLGEARTVRPCPELPELPPPLDRIALACRGKTAPIGRAGETLAYRLGHDPFFGKGTLFAWIGKDHARALAIGEEAALFFAIPNPRLPPPEDAWLLDAAPELALPLPEAALEPAAFALSYPGRLYVRAHRFRLEVRPLGREGGLVRYAVRRHDLLGGEAAAIEVFGDGVLGPHYLNQRLARDFLWAALGFTWEGNAGGLTFAYQGAPLLEAAGAKGRIEKLTVYGPKGPRIVVRRLP